MDIGITQAELRKQVISAVVEKLLARFTEPESDITEEVSRSVRKELIEQIQKKVQSAVLPLIKTKLNGLLIPQTNIYGEPKTEPLTFIEFAIQQSERYLTEQVDYEGKAKGDSYGSWTGKQTRITHMVHKYLHYEIERAMKQALSDANAQIVKGLEETCKIQLGIIASQLKVEVKTR